VRLDPYGLARVMAPPGVLPQQALRLDPSLPLRDDELRLSVEALNVDAASFRQLRQTSGDDPQAIARTLAEIVQQRGKLQNPVTGSGGMLLGSVRGVGPAHPARSQLEIGDRVATLVSLTLTPLHLDEVTRVDLHRDRVEVRGHAILFASGAFSKIPRDLPEALVLAALDVCGAPALTARHVRPGMRVLVLGAGKSGALCAAQAARSGATQVLACDIDPAATEALERLGYAQALVADATQALVAAEAVRRATNGALCDLVINVASVPGTEMASLLAVRDGGVVIFFSMATSFTQAALGAEGIGKDATLIIGNGYVPGHAELTLDLLRSELPLRRLLESRFVGSLG
jgi:L-erythro-3,5-diaminohexanoate dehydrogenase